MILRICDLVPASPRLDRSSAPPAFTGYPASLTDALATNGAFVGALLPNSRTAVTAINRAIKTPHFIAPSATTANARLYSSVALAVDRGVLFFCGSDLVRHPVAYLQRHGEIGTQIGEVARSYQPPTHHVLSSRSALGWFYLLGRLEPVIRGFRPLSDVDISALPRKLTRRSSEDWLRSLVPLDVAAEIADLLRAVRDNRVPGAIRPNPVFGGLGWITGSDGDWIAGDTLVELKCTVGGLQRNHVAQLLCYYAFDQLCSAPEQRFGFSSLALCLPRQRCTIVGSIDAWLAAFGGPTLFELPRFVQGWCSE